MTRCLRGFTLLEVLVALAVLAVAMGAIIKAASQSANNVGYLKNQTLAGWVAENRINDMMLADDWPESDTRRGTAEMGGQTWWWEIRINETTDEDLRRLDVTVGLENTVEATAKLTAFKQRPSS